MAEGVPAGTDPNSFLGKAWELQHKADRFFANIQRGRFARVLKMARRPEPEEFRHSSIVVLAAIVVVGLIGFLVYLMMGEVLGWVNAR